MINQGDAPTNILLSGSSVAENVVSGTSIGSFQAVDQDSGDTHTFDIVPGLGDNDNAKFLIDSGTLKTAALIDFETQSSYSIRVRATDQNSLTFEKQLIISVIDMPEWSFSGGILTVTSLIR